jgi:hypothetical protein
MSANLTLISSLTLERSILLRSLLVGNPSQPRMIRIILA